MKIELPNVDDWEIINKLSIQVHELHVKWRPDLFNSVEQVITKEELEIMIDNKEIFVAKLDSIIVGYIIFTIKEKTNQNPKFRRRKLLNIETVCVDENYRGKGIGTLLLNYGKQVGINNNCTDMYLTVNEENINAIKTYEKFGMRVKNIAYSMRIDQ